ncbi:hypothetical protein HZA87_02510 [Candidatus Uhrbacteria bacterium]|nr:hypothetical protein [Candidatus Uhrbacteria bacterium]
MTREEVIKLVQDSHLSAAGKNTWISRIRQEGLTKELVDDLKGAFQVEIDAGFEKLGIDISDTPEYKSAEAAMVKDVEAAKAGFDQKMAGLASQVKQAEADALKAVDDIKIQNVKSSIA